MKIVLVLLRGLVFAPIAIAVFFLAIPLLPVLAIAAFGHYFCEEVLQWKLCGEEETTEMLGKFFSDSPRPIKARQFDSP